MNPSVFLSGLVITGTTLQCSFSRMMPTALFGHRAQNLANAMHCKYDLSSLVRRTGQHFVRAPSFFEREHGAYLRGQLTAIEQARECAQPCRGNVYHEERRTKARMRWRWRNHRHDDAARL